MKGIRVEVHSKDYSYQIDGFLMNTEDKLFPIDKAQNILIVLRNNTVIGMGLTWINSMHPYRDYISIYLNPEERNKGIGFFLFCEMERRYQLKNLQTFLSADDDVAVSFAKKCGFSLARQSYIYEVTKQKLSDSYSKPSGKIVQFNQLATHQLDEVLALQYADYKENHQAINPLNTGIKLSEWKRTIFKDLAKADSFVLIDNQHIVAYIMCYEADVMCIEVGYTGNRLKTIEEYENFLYEVTVKLFERYRIVELEVDDCDPSANVLKDLFRHDPTVSWDTYVK